jgi:hypothetical protein
MQVRYRLTSCGVKHHSRGIATDIIEWKTKGGLRSVKFRPCLIIKPNHSRSQRDASRKTHEKRIGTFTSVSPVREGYRRGVSADLRRPQKRRF